MSDTYQAPESLNRMQTAALGVGGIGVLVSLAGMFLQPEPALRGWLLGFIFWAGIGFGGLGILLLQYVTGGAWGVVIRRVAEACSRTIPLLAVLFLPIVFGLYTLYDWANLAAAGTDYAIEWRGWYMEPTWWIVRAAVYFVLLFLMSMFLNRWSLQQDKAETPEKAAEYLGMATKVSGPGIVLYVMVVTFLSVDWTMTLEPHWFSTIWGFLFVAGWALSCFCFSVAILAHLSTRSPMDEVLGKRHFHDIGKLMLALVMVWAYFNFSQYLIIWSGNLTEETPFYLVRSKGVWGGIGLTLIFFHFAFPFLILLMQDFKRKAKWLAALAIFILFMRVLDMFYIIGPAPMVGEVSQHLLEVPFRLSIWDVVAPIGIGGVWFWWFVRELKQRPIVPFNDPMFKNAIKHGKGH
ncbi:MAG: hypothetical protein DWQ47_01300 [Acidobacteria bacterium]|nr:MAG: hypothetical protein DWQ32_11760 [Acidobacteriota bacterium]REK04136.1 MAG: hypothetical protein DWQ38_01285 [Acidobacteriota bacterium]REK15298.1 MAG: hypothetical protein DWQ43_17450 [Acidobacteriota bacterium]REK46388.1 MAG: hypothetical protein DWQ47_01300 [Acidobacteriota bacterium]